MVIRESGGRAMRKIIALILAVGIGAVLMGWSPIGATAAELPKIDPSTASTGALQTTWRPGDLVNYTVACHSAKDVTRLGKNWSDVLWSKLVATGKCFQLTHSPVPAILVKWLSGPYSAMKDGSTGPMGSIWEIIDSTGDTEYLFLDDTGGPHSVVVNWRV